MGVQFDDFDLPLERAEANPTPAATESLELVRSMAVLGEEADTMEPSSAPHSLWVWDDAPGTMDSPPASPGVSFTAHALEIDQGPTEDLERTPATSPEELCPPAVAEYESAAAQVGQGLLEVA